MTFDYDLVIIGSSPAAIYAAKTAARWQARVALVQPESSQMNWLMPSSLYGRAAINLLDSRLGDTNWGKVDWGEVDWGKTKDNLGWSESANQTQLPDSSFSGLSQLDRLNSISTGFESIREQNATAVLASAGIDVIAGNGQFIPKPRLAFEVNNRLLRSRAYLLATGSHPAIPSDIPELTAPNSLLRTEIENFITRPISSIPKSLIVIGAEPRGIELAQTFARLGSQVTLIVPSATLLPAEDPEAAQLILAQLEVEGVDILLDTQVTQIKSIDNKKWVQAGDRAIDADEILLAAGYQPNIESLNLERVGVEYAEMSEIRAIGHHLQVNRKMQTTNPRIYACGEVAGGYSFPHVAECEARIALKNALFLPICKVDYSTIPWALFSKPQLARVGLTEPQARRRYGEDIVVLRKYFKSVTAAALRGETTGFCKIIARSNGKIVGVHIVGPEATELIHSFTLMIKNGIKVGAIASVPHIWPTLSEINRQTAELWQRDRLRPWQNFLEAFFNWRRG